jgi:hypothetical protein
MERRELPARRGVHLGARIQQGVDDVRARGARQARVERGVGVRVPRAGARVRAARQEEAHRRRLTEVGSEVERGPSIPGVREDGPRVARE